MRRRPCGGLPLLWPPRSSGEADASIGQMSSGAYHRGPIGHIGGLTVAVGFGVFFHAAPVAALWLFIATLPLMGIGTNSDFAVFTLWLPELYPTRLRATGFAFGTSAGRFLGALGPFVVGNLIAHYNNLGTGVATTALVFLIGLLLIPFAKETKGMELQA